MRFSLRSPLGRVREAAWPIVRAALAAGVAWALAQAVLGHAQPVFAPSAAVVALAASVEGRGAQAAEMLLGVAVGVVVGEGLVLVLGMGASQVVLAAAAMLVMAAVEVSPLPLIQAGSSAVLVVALQSPQSGAERMLDALIGGVALLVSQILFPPSPVSLLKGAGREVLSALAEGLTASAQALAGGDAASAGAALQRLRAEGRSSNLSDLDAAREKGGKVARRTLRGRLEAKRFGHLDARVERLDLLSVNVLLLSRATHRLLDERVAAPDWLVRAIRDLARALEALAKDPESTEVMHRASDAAACKAARGDAFGTPDPRVALAAEGLRFASSDVAKLAASEGAGLGPTPRRWSLRHTPSTSGRSMPCFRLRGCGSIASP